jgi:hypothetical protein
MTGKSCSIELPVQKDDFENPTFARVIRANRLSAVGAGNELPQHRSTIRVYSWLI